MKKKNFKKVSHCALMECLVPLVSRVKVISFFIGTRWYFSTFFIFINTYWGRGGKLNFRTKTWPCFTLIWGLWEKLKSFDITTILRDCNLLDNSDSSIGSLQDKRIVWLSTTKLGKKLFLISVQCPYHCFFP